MKLSSVPDLKGNQYPERISVALSSDAKRKLDLLKRNQRKDTAELVRMLIDEFLQENEITEQF